MQSLCHLMNCVSPWYGNRCWLGVQSEVTNVPFLFPLVQKFAWMHALRSTPQAYLSAEHAHLHLLAVNSSWDYAIPARAVLQFKGIRSSKWLMSDELCHKGTGGIMSQMFSLQPETFAKSLSSHFWSCTQKPTKCVRAPPPCSLSPENLF